MWLRLHGCRRLRRLCRACGAALQWRAAGAPLGRACRLTHLKTVYSKQLPNMPREYIARLVFERRHRSVGIVAPSGLCLGGITYRTFPNTPCRCAARLAQRTLRACLRCTTQCSVTAFVWRCLC